MGCELKYMQRFLHDLKEPMRGLSCFVDLINSSNSEQEKVEYLAMMKHCIEKMQMVFNSALLYTTNNCNEEIEEIDLKEIINDVKDLLFLNLNHSKVNIITEEMPKILGHKIKITHLFYNLISNGSKFSNPEREEKFVKISYNNGIFAIKDNGIGISLEQAHNIFNENVDSVTLGLKICKAIVEGYEGRIWFESKENEGTSFYFTLPQCIK